MNRATILALLLVSMNASAYFDSTNDLATEASVLWGNVEWSGSNVVAMTSSYSAGGYNHVASFAGTAASTAHYDTASVYVTFESSVGSLDFTQHTIRAKAQFTDTFVISGPIGSGTVVYSYGINSSLSTSELIVEGQPTNIVHPTIRLSETFFHDGLEVDVKPITYGKPFVVRCEVEGEITLYGTNFNNMNSISADYSCSLLGFTPYDRDGNVLSNSFTVVSSSGAIAPRGPPVVIEEMHTNIVMRWHSVTNAIYSLSTAPHVEGSWTRVLTGIVGNGSANLAELPISNGDELYIRLEME